MINGRNIKISENFSNRNILKVEKFGVLVFRVFEPLNIFRAAGKNDPPGLIGLITIKTA